MLANLFNGASERAMANKAQARWQALRHSRWWPSLKAGALLGGLGMLVHWALEERSLVLWDWRLLPGLLLSQLSMLAYAQRLRAVLQIGGITMGFRAALRTTMLSVFWHFFVPLSVGAELTRYNRIRQHAPQHSRLEIGATLALDHLLGAGVLLILSSVLLFTLAPLGRWSWCIPLAALALLGLGLLVARRVLARRLWPETAFSQLWRRRRETCKALAYSALMHSLLAAAVWLGSRGWQIALDYPQLLFVQSSAGLFQALPLNVAGAGAGEVAGLGLYLLMGLSRADALLLVSLLYCYKIAMAVLGGLWELGDPQPHSPSAA